jgi:hypothetical protein
VGLERDPLSLVRITEDLGTDIRFDVLRAVTVKNAVSWDIKPLFLPHRKPISLRYRAQPVNDI